VAARSKVLLIGWDAADWKVIHPLMDAGKMPNIQRLVEAGSMAQIATLHPPLSPMLWTSIATGKRPFKHGIHGFSEPTPDGRGIQPVTNLSRRTKAVWNILNQNGLRSIVAGWWPSEDNPRAVKQLQTDAQWIDCARGKAVKIVAPPAPALPPGICCRLILMERNLDEILDSQTQMLVRHGESLEDSPARRARLKEEYTRLVQSVKAMARTRPGIQILTLDSEAVLRDPRAAAEAIDRFLGGGLAVDAMAAQVKPELHRQRREVKAAAG
jgi:hypothetical protein